MVTSIRLSDANASEERKDAVCDSRRPHLGDTLLDQQLRLDFHRLRDVVLVLAAIRQNQRSQQIGGQHRVRTQSVAVVLLSLARKTGARVSRTRSREKRHEDRAIFPTRCDL